MEDCYKTPEGFADYPFIYRFNGAGLVDGASPQNLAVAVRGDADFILRRVMGLPSLAQSMRLRNASKSEAFSALSRIGQNYSVVPEKVYPRASTIGFDLGVVARTFIGCGLAGANNIFTAFLGFQGVRRQVLGPVRPGRSVYRYYERPFTYTLDLNVDWFRYVTLPAAVVEAPRRFQIQVNNYDFELHTITAVRSNGAAPDVTTVDFLLKLYDSGQYELMVDHVPLQWVNYTRSGDLVNSAFQSCFPVPPVLYPINSVMEVEVVSMVCNTDADSPKSYQMLFRGIERVPC